MDGDLSGVCTLKDFQTYSIVTVSYFHRKNAFGVTLECSEIL